MKVCTPILPSAVVEFEKSERFMRSVDSLAGE